MQPTTFNYDTELSAVNSILASIGQAPITRLNFENPEVSMIYNLLQEASRDVQSEGWHFNREQHYTLTPENDNHIYIPSNVLRMDVSDNATYRTTDVVMRQGKLYDKLRHSFEFDKPMDFDMVWFFPFEDLPTVFQRYITYRASVRAAGQMVTNVELARMLSQQEAFSRSACMEYECNQGDFTMFGTPDNTSYRSYQPYRALAR